MNSFISFFSHATPVGLAVMVILAIFSLISWSIIFSKWAILGNMLKHNGLFIEQFWHTKDLGQLLEQAHKNSPSAQVFRDGVNEFERQKIKTHDKPEAFLIIERAMVRSGRQELKHAESKLAFLATVGSLSPFIGLFGTVVGIMAAIQEIGQAGNANLSTVAPGIAEALLATAFGLFVAIPAMMAYNLFQTKLRSLRADLENFSLDLLAVLRSQR